MAPKAKKPKLAPLKQVKFYVPRQLPDLEARIAAAATAMGEKELRDVTNSEWIVKAILEKLGRDAKETPL